MSSLTNYLFEKDVIGSGHCSQNPFALDVAQALSEQEDAKGAKDTKIDGE